MTVHRFSPEGVAPPTGGYSHVALTEPGARLAWFAGQVGRLADGAMPTSVRQQTAAAFDNLEVLFSRCGLGPKELVQLRTYLVGRTSLPEFVAERELRFADWFGAAPPPPNTLLFVEGLADDRALVEIEAVGVVPRLE